MAKYASPGSRIMAVIVDTVILFVIMAILAIPFGLSALLFESVATPTGAANLFFNMANWGMFFVLNAIVWLLYFTYFESTTGQTPGKKLMNIKVVREKGRMTVGSALIRTILRIIDGMFLYLLGLVVILVTEKKQRIGDMAAGTVVVKA